MGEDYNKIGFVIVLCLIVALVFLLRKYINDKKRELVERAEAQRSQIAMIVDIVSGFLASFMVVILLGIALRFCLSPKVLGTHIKNENCEETCLTQQTSDVWNISGRVGQDGVISSDSQRWPTHDHRLSMDSFVLANGIHIAHKDQLPPPLYCEVDLPTYEQATGTSPPQNDIPPVHISSTSSRNLDHSHS